MDEELDRITPAEAGFAPDLAERLDDARAAGLLRNLHGVVALRGGRMFFERYLAGTDWTRGRPSGIVRFGPEMLHDLRSVTKSIVVLLYGIALAAGEVPEPDAVLIDQFPAYADLAADPARRRLTMRHVLSMTLGMEWDETSLPYSDPRNSEIAMDRAPDRIRYILERPIIEAPGQRWHYHGGATALLARLIAQGTGRDLHDYASEMLFAPLGITRTEWSRDKTGEVIAASGLRMRPRDLARIGQMVLQGGQWNGRQIVPADWLATALSAVTTMPDGTSCGYHWYLRTIAMNDGGNVRAEPMQFAAGNGGQRIFVVPRLDVAVAVTAGNYDVPDHWRIPLVVLRDVLLAALRE